MMLLGPVAETRVVDCLLSTLEPQNDTDSPSNEGVPSENMLIFTINGFGKLRSMPSDMMEILCRPIVPPCRAPSCQQYRPGPLNAGSDPTSGGWTFSHVWCLQPSNTWRLLVRVYATFNSGPPLSPRKREKAAERSAQRLRLPVSVRICSSELG